MPRRSRIVRANSSEDAPLAPEEKTSSNGEFPRQPLLSVERQIETNLETGRSQTRMFVKMYFEARDSGLLAALPAELWQTLCCLATYMDADGYCYPGQSRMARELGISRQQLNARLKRLVAFRFQERPVIHVKKERRSEAGQWAGNVYKVLPISGLGIFGESGPVPRRPEKAPKTVSTALDKAAASGRPDAARPDMNQSPRENEITQRVCDIPKREEAEELVSSFHARIGRAASRATAKELHQATDLIAAHGVAAARFIVEFAVEQAAQTRFRMRHFGAVSSYVDEALARLERQRSKAANEAQARERCREEDLRIRYEAWRRKEVERLKATMDPGDLAALEEAMQRQILREYGSNPPPAAETLLRIRLTETLAERKHLPSFDEWKALQGRRSARPVEPESTRATSRTGSSLLAAPSDLLP